MKNKATLLVGFAALLVGVLLLYSATYTVRFNEFAIRTRIDGDSEVVRDAGLHFKLPFVFASVAKFDKRLQLVESPLKTVQTKDGQQLLVQAYLLWKVGDGDEQALSFFTSYGGSLDQASMQLASALDGAISEIGSFRFDQLVGPQSRLAEAEERILKGVQGSGKVGVDPVRVGISQVVLPPKTTISVLSRMAEVQNTLAKLEEARGSSEASAITSQATSQADLIRHFAEQWAARIEARGNEEAAASYEEMNKHADLAMFLAWLDALKSGLRGSTTFVTDTTKAPFHLLNLDSSVDSKGIPTPQAHAESAVTDASSGKGTP